MDKLSRTKNIGTLHRDGNQVLKNLYKSSAWTDFTVILGNREFRLHKAIVCPAIPYFDTMLTINLKESKENKVIISDEMLDIDIFEILINYAYSESLQLTYDNVKPILVAADFLQMDQVFRLCCNFLVKTLSTETACQIREWLSFFNASDLLNQVDNFIANEFLDVCSTQGFANLSIDNFSQLICRSDLTIECPDDLEKAIYIWINHDPQERKKYIPQLLQSIKPANLSVLSLNQDVKDLIPQKANNYTKSKPCDMLRSLVIISSSTAKHNQRSSLELTTFDNESAQWRQIKTIDMTNPFESLIQSTSLGSNIYIIGGKLVKIDCGNSPGSLEYLSYYEAPGSAISSYQAHLVVSGGLEHNNEPINGVKLLVPNFDNSYLDSKPITSMKCRRAHHTLVSVWNKLYAIGGTEGHRMELSSVEQYDPIEENWNYVAPMLSRRAYHGTAAFHGKIYVCGGSDGRQCLNSFESYDPVMNKWTSLAPMHHKRTQVTLISYNSDLYAIGGYSDRKPLNNCEIYDPRANVWTNYFELPVSTSILGAVAARISMQELKKEESKD